MQTWQSDLPALSRALAPVFDERDDPALDIEGAIPPALHGVFMRNGPNPRFAPGPGYTYPFDGTGMIHAVYLDAGRARYRNRWVRTQEFNEEAAAGHRLYNAGFAPPPHANLANTHVIHHAGRFLALYEGGLPYEIDAQLNTRGCYDGDGRLPAAMSAHPKLDPRTGELLSVTYNLRTGSLHYVRITPEGTVDRCVPIPSPWSAMIHDIAITTRHVLAFVCPLVFDLDNPAAPMRWSPERGARLALIPREARSAQDVRWVDGPAFFHWHTLNAFEEDGRIDVTLPWYAGYGPGASDRRLALHRIVIDARSGAWRDEPLDDQACEFGRINEALLGQRARYGYVGLRQPRAGEVPQAGAFEALARYDLDTGAKQVFTLPAGVTAGEPVFVADPTGQAEDDGFLMVFTHIEGSPQGQFLILDARDLGQGPLATVRLPRRVPGGLHGSWTPYDEAAS
ncbi:carotenoid oxygenase family protein [Pseudomonadota bacterium AL_CKDN230030165-1A_HGKHYDSX7]